MNSINNNNTIKAIEIMDTSSDYLYIPRIKDTDANSETVYQILLDFGIGVVEYVDFIAVRDKMDRTNIIYYSAFVKLYCWGVNYVAASEFRKNKTFKLFINPREFWMLLPNNNPVPRSKINTHQLAAFTEELFEKVATQNQVIAIQDQKIKNQDQEIERQRSIIETFEERIAMIEQRMMEQRI
jgi:hypothetical protein